MLGIESKEHKLVDLAFPRSYFCINREILTSALEKLFKVHLKEIGYSAYKSDRANFSTLLGNPLYRVRILDKLDKMKRIFPINIYKLTDDELVNKIPTYQIKRIINELFKEDIEELKKLHSYIMNISQYESVIESRNKEKEKERFKTAIKFLLFIAGAVVTKLIEMGIDKLFTHPKSQRLSSLRRLLFICPN